jgi:hypothetical protein
MAVKFKSIAGKVSALALAVSALALPAAAQAQEEGRQVRDNEAAGNIGGGNEARRAPRSAPAEGGWSRGDNGNGGGWSRPAQAQAPVAVPQAAPAGDYQQGRAAQAPGWNRSAERREGNGWNGNPRGWENRGGGNWRGDNARPAPVPQPQAAPEQAAQGRSWNRDRTIRSDDARRTERSGTWWRQEGDRTYRDADRRGDDNRWRDRNREEYRRDNDRRWDNRGDRRWDNRNDRRWDNRGDRQRYGYNHDYRRWDNRWRDNRRYDWYSYRRSYPNTYRVGVYYSPYRNYSYRRLNVGFFLDSLFFSNRYWINDPWQYRLPDVYGPYRWVRYYDDALLVNTYTGEVVDVIYSFFW